MASIVLDNEPHFSRLHVTAVSGQVQNLFELRDPAGVVLYGIGPGGSAAASVLTAPDAASTPLVVKAFSGQTADLLQLQNSSGVGVGIGDRFGRIGVKEGTTTSALQIDTPNEGRGRLFVDAQVTGDTGNPQRGLTLWIEPGTGASVARSFRAFELAAVIKTADTGAYTNANAVLGGLVQSFYRGDSAGSCAGSKGLLINVGKQTGSGALTAATGIDVQIGNYTGGSGAITDGFGVLIRDASLAGTATLTNQYGLYIENQTKGGTLKRSIYSLGATAEFRTGADANIGLIVRGNSASQSGNLIECRDSSDNLNLVVAANTATRSGWLSWRFGTAMFEQDSVAGVGSTNRFVIQPQGDRLDILNEAGAATLFSIQNNSVVLRDPMDLVLGTTTGTKIGTVGGAAGQKLSFWNATPIVQPLLATGAGATADNIITVLQNLGLCRQA